MFVARFVESVASHEVTDRLVRRFAWQAHDQALRWLLVADTAKPFVYVVLQVGHGLSMPPDPTALRLFVRWCRHEISGVWTNAAENDW
jgi:hypothetical protein